MPERLLVYFTLGVLLTCMGSSQELAPIQNYTPTDYKAQNQNWSISQDEDKIVYVANNEGLLEFNGAKWKLYRSPNKTIIRAVEVIDSKIYTGCYMEFGYWERNELGVLNYTSISNSLKIELKEDEEFWKIVKFEDWILFQSLQRIYIYNPSNNSARIIEAQNEIIHLYTISGAILYQERDKGIFQITNGEGKLIMGQDILKNDEVVDIFNEERGYLILTRKNGFFHFTKGRINEWISTNKQIDQFNIYSSLKTKDNEFVLGTISNGLIHLSRDGNIIYRYDQNKGLINNTVLSIYEDSDQNIWLGLDNGISLINRQSPLKIFRDIKGTLGSTYASIVHENRLYLGTNQGLFQKQLTIDQPFQLINGTEGQVWSLRILFGELFCGHHNGTFVVNGAQASLISDIKGTWNLEILDENTIIQGNYDGLYILTKEKNQWRLKNKVKGFNNSSRQFARHKNKILVNHEYKGIFNLTVDDNYTQVTKVQIDSTLKHTNSSIAKYNGETLYGYEKGILKYDFEKDSFSTDSTLSSYFNSANFLSGKICKSGKQNEFWLFMRDKLTRVSSDNLIDVPKFTSVPLIYDTRQEVTEFENVIHLISNTYLIGTSYGYLTIDLDNIDVRDFSIEISSISNGINPNHSLSSNLININENENFDYDENNLSFNFHTSSYKSYYKPLYQHRLIGLYDVWSEWSSSSTVFYENLPPGSYEFNVRSKVGNKLSQNTSSYQFTIAKPWYASNLMILAYALVVICFSIFMHNVYKIYYKRQQHKLIDKNKNQLELAKLQSENEIMELKNEQLAKENKNKSNELAASTMSIIKKNELLNQIKEQLAKVGDSKIIKPVIKTIDQNLNQRKNWELFQKAFNNADQDFFKKLTEVHPDLSPNDLKLCAYLRLNLTSKEIAGLINISPRSVEVKRYRLRKKLGLDNNENLANYIINI